MTVSPYKNSLARYAGWALTHAAVVGVLYAAFTGISMAYAFTSAAERAPRAAAMEALGQAVGFVLGATLALAERPILVLGAVLAGYAVYLVSKRDHNDVRFYTGQSLWRSLLAAMVVSSFAVWYLMSGARLGLENERFAATFVYAVAVLAAVHYHGYGMIEVQRGPLSITDWERLAWDFAVRGSLVVAAYDLLVGLPVATGLGLQFLPVAFVGLFLAGTAVRGGLAPAVTGTDGLRQRSLAASVRSDGGGGAVTGGNHPADPDDPAGRVEESPDLDFDDVAGMAELKATLRERVVDPLATPGRFERLGLSVTNGVLLHGPPGTGKTYVSKALAGELGYGYVSISPAEITSKYVGESSSNVASTFDLARDHQPCVVFIDELDAIATDRGEDMSGSERGMVNQLLEELSELNESDDDVVVLAATNRLDEVDEAIKRPGRFDETIEVGLPDQETRVAVLKHHFGYRDIDTGAVDWETVGEATSGRTSSNLQLVVDNVARRLVDGEAAVTTDLLVSALGETRAGTPSGSGGEFLTPTPDASFDDVVGLEGLKATLREQVVDPLEAPEEHEEYGLSATNGVLLHGPPGTGKTLASRALAGELGLDYVELDPASVVSKYVGESAENIADAFTVARQHQPCVVFIDELDAIAPSRNGRMQQSERRVVNQLLEELESIQDTDIVVVGATNLPDRVDDAVARSGRFDERVEVPRPDAGARAAILRHYLAEHSLTPVGVDWSLVGELTDDYTGSDVELLAETVARAVMARDGEDRSVSQADLDDAIERTAPSPAG